MTTPFVSVSKHPLLLHKLSQLRDRETSPPRFRQLVKELTSLLFFEASQDLHLQPCPIETPMALCQGHQIADRIAILPILRAGLGMAEAMLEILPEVKVWHLGLYRDHDTRRPVTYYNRIPTAIDADLCVVLDPMLATGGSAAAAISILKGLNVRTIKFLGLIAAPEGVKALTEAHPDVPVFLAAIDSHLNDHAYIIPGLGDAGDRQFATG